MLPRGFAWFIVIPMVILVVMLVALLIIDKRDYSWCGVKLGAGDCMLDESERITTCYCIDGDKPVNRSSDLFEQAQQNCQRLNGSIATPHTDDELIWLSKRMFETGIENAFIGLVKMESEWFWVGIEGLGNAQNISWRPDFPPTENGTHAVVTVETREKAANSIENEAIEYIYFNYDHYIEKDRSYVWYGFTTSDNAKIFNDNGYFYYICHYVSEPFIAPEPEMTTAIAKTENEGICECSEAEVIELTVLGQSHKFQSPRYPKNYCSDLSCRWTIQTEQKLAIKLDWLVFDTENKMDFVYVFDGPTGDAPMIQTCSGPHCSDSTSSTNYMHIHFNSDHVTTDLGFRAEVTAIETDPCYCSPLVKLSLSNIGDSYTIYSPMQPKPYCPNHNCKWTFSAPEHLKVGLQVGWSQFDIEASDSVFVYDGESEEYKELSRCTKNSCDSTISSGKNIHIKFISDEHTTSEHTGFAGIVTVVRNYCEKSDLLLERHSGSGAVIYDAENQDGTVPSGATATIVCPQGHKIQNTMEDTVDSTICESSVWKEHLRPCMPYCRMPNLHRPILSGAVVKFCRYSETDKKFVQDTNTVTLEIMEMGYLQDSHVFTCLNSTWEPEEPFCEADKLGIMLIGGNNGKHNQQKRSYASIDFYFPPPLGFTKELPFKLLTPRSGHVAEAIDHRRVIVAGGEEEGRPGEARQDTEIIDIFDETVVLGPRMNFPRLGAASSRFNGSIWVCGGSAGSDPFALHTQYSCDVFDGQKWNPQGSYMYYWRTGLALLPFWDTLLALGGSNKDVYSNHLYPNRDRIEIERLIEIDGNWTDRFPPLSVGRVKFGAAVYWGSIYACGGMEFMTSCDVFDPHTYKWSTDPMLRLIPPRSSFSLVSFGGALFALGGEEITIEMYYRSQWSYSGWESIGELRKETHDAVAIPWPPIQYY